MLPALGGATKAAAPTPIKATGVAHREVNPGVEVPDVAG